jgi:membrane-associated phospholipid phosphatase
MKKILLFLLFIAQFSQAQQDTTFRKMKTKSFIVPVALMATGTVALGSYFKDGQRSYYQKNFADFRTRLDDISQAAPLGIVFGLDIIGVHGKHTFGEKAVLLIISESIMLATVNGLKYTTDVLRPDGSTFNSFPSGHTANAFLGADMLSEEYGDKSIWYSIGGYSIASATGAMRMMNNRHWASDVLVGAGIGILSSKASYAIYPWLKEKVFKKKNVVFLPKYDGQATLAVFIVQL